MKRLRDEVPAGDTADTLARRLVRAARPLEVPVALRREVRRGLPTRPRPASFGLRTALVAATLAVFGVASAMTAHWWQRRERAPIERRGEPSRPMRTPTESRPAAPTPIPMATPAPTRSSSILSSSPSTPVTSSGAAAHPSQRAIALSPVSSAEIPLPTPSATASDELVLYLDGVDALRARHDPSAAARLFARYREAYPNGSFVEDSFALSMEAASSEGEAPHDLAAAYAARFPHGRYRKLAAQVLAR
jgi:hypothetical protein